MLLLQPEAAHRALVERAVVTHVSHSVSPTLSLALQVCQVRKSASCPEVSLHVAHWPLNQTFLMGLPRPVGQGAEA